MASRHDDGLSEAASEVDEARTDDDRRAGVASASTTAGPTGQIAPASRSAGAMGSFSIGSVLSGAQAPSAVGQPITTGTTGAAASVLAQLASSTSTPAPSRSFGASNSLQAPIAKHSPPLNAHSAPGSATSRKRKLDAGSRSNGSSVGGLEMNGVTKLEMPSSLFSPATSSTTLALPKLNGVPNSFMQSPTQGMPLNSLVFMQPPAMTSPNMQMGAPQMPYGMYAPQDMHKYMAAQQQAAMQQQQQQQRMQSQGMYLSPGNNFYNPMYMQPNMQPGMMTMPLMPADYQQQVQQQQQPGQQTSPGFFAFNTQPISAAS
jgi:hypothetical protein